MMPRDDLRTPQPPSSATTMFSPGPPTPHHSYSLPNNPMPYLAPSVTHQPELLLLHWMINTISSLAEDLQHHPMVRDPIPPISTFTNTPAYRLFLQTRNTLRHLINTTHDARRGLNRLQFLPGSPGSPGHYRIDPTLDIPPQQTNLLLRSHLSTQPSHTITHQHTTAPPPVQWQRQVSFPRPDHTLTAEPHNLRAPDHPRPTFRSSRPPRTPAPSTLDGLQLQFHLLGSLPPAC